MAQITNNVNPSLDGELNKAETKQVNGLLFILKEFVEARREAEQKETELKLKLKEILKPAYFKYNQYANLS